MAQRVEQLSGGQRQAVAIARATAFEAKVVIMDEPTAALAVREVRKVLDLIKDLRTHGISVILISHRLDDIFYVCDRVMALFHGRNFADAPLSRDRPQRGHRLDHGQQERLGRAGRPGSQLRDAGMTDAMSAGAGSDLGDAGARSAWTSSAPWAGSTAGACC